MDSAFIHQAANELVQTAGTRNIKQIARSCSLDISETSRIKDMLGLLSLYFDKPLILINRQLDKQTKQMVCGYALGHYLEHQLLMDLHTLDKFLTIKDKHILLYEHNAFTSHLMLDSDEVYQMTKRGLDAAQIAAAKESTSIWCWRSCWNCIIWGTICVTTTPSIMRLSSISSCHSISGLMLRKDYLH